VLVTDYFINCFVCLLLCLNIEFPFEKESVRITFNVARILHHCVKDSMIKNLKFLIS
jgi:hypothetical protein